VGRQIGREAGIVTVKQLGKGKNRNLPGKQNSPLTFG